MPEQLPLEEQDLTGFENLSGLSRPPIVCLGRTFASEDERRAYFRARLAEHLADPGFRLIEGFPLGDDQAILDLSDPPYYTACPNPFLPEILAEWEGERERRREGETQRGGENETQGRSEDNASPPATRNSPPATRHPALPPRALRR